MTDSPNDRSALAQAMDWAYRAMAVAMEMVVPGLLGIWLDRLLGTWVLFAVIGFGAGLTLAIWQLARIADATTQAHKPAGGDHGPQSPLDAGQPPDESGRP